MLYPRKRTLQHYTTYTPSGQKIDNIASLTNGKGEKLAAYDIAPGTQAGNAVVSQQYNGSMTRDERWSLIQLLRKRGYSVPDDISDEELKNLAVSSSLEGLPTIDDLGGNHNGGILTKAGTADKNTPNVRQGGTVWAQNVPGAFERLNR